MVDDAARQIGVRDRDGFRDYIHEAKKQEGRRASDNYTYQELLELAAEFLGSGQR